MANIWFEKKHRKITHSMGVNETEIDFVLVGKNKKVLKRRESNLLKSVTWAGDNKQTKESRKKQGRTNKLLDNKN